MLDFVDKLTFHLILLLEESINHLLDSVHVVDPSCDFADEQLNQRTCSSVSQPRLLLVYTLKLHSDPTHPDIPDTVLAKFSAQSHSQNGGTDIQRTSPADLNASVLEDDAMNIISNSIS